MCVRPSGGDLHIDSRRLGNPVRLVGNGGGDGLPPCLLRQRDELLEHQLPRRPRQLVHIGGGEALGGNGIQDCERRLARLFTHLPSAREEKIQGEIGRAHV